MALTPEPMPLPFGDEWFPEEEYEEKPYEIEEPKEVWRLVNKYGKERNFGCGQRISRYTTEAGAKMAATKYLRIWGEVVAPQKGIVTWNL